MPSISFDRFYRYEDLTRLLHEYAAEFPHLFKIESIGKSHEGRDVWLITATNFASGPDAEKPALWVDGNLHATEVAGSTAVLYFIHTLAQGYGKDKTITDCLDSRTFYIVPRVNPDGAELALADKPRMVRSSTRPYPYDEDRVEGLTAYDDIDGDGRVLAMRIGDQNGAWKTHPDDPRLMIRREAVDTGGTYYRLLPEGWVKNFDGVTIQVKGPKEGLDLNRNFPVAWRQENDQLGAGPYPVSEAEARNLVDFIVRHPNLTGVVTFHTFSGVILRPYDDRSDEELPADDLWTYKKIGEKGTALTGYPNISTFHEFRYHPKTITTGGFDTWMYDHLGMFAWTVEIWSPMRQAGIKDYKYIDWFREHSLEDDIKLMKWNDDVLGGKAYVDWYEFNHPQLGKVELGGWDQMNSWTNPPPAFLEKEVALFPQWILWHLLISPKLELREVDVKALGGGAYRVRLVVENSGWLPTYVTKKALEKKVSRGVICEIELPPGAFLQTGKVREELAQLEGWVNKSAFADPFEGSTDDRLKVEWVVNAPNGGKVKLTARHERAGVVRAEVELKE
jgi:murein tripeptide amidase MpaA